MKIGDATIGSAIRLARAQRWMEQKELADLLGVKQQMVSSWELTGRVARKHWPKLAEVLGVEMSTFSARQKTPRKISYLRGVFLFATV